MTFLRVAATLAAMMSESDAGGGGAGESPERELARLREENARLRGEQPPSDTDADRARREQDLRGPAQGDTDAARQARREEEGRRAQKTERKRLTGDESSRELARFVQQNAVFQSGASQDELDRLRISMGDEQHEAHVAIRDYHRALANHRGHPNTPAGSAALEKEIKDALAAVEGNPIAQRRLEKIERSRRRNEPVDLNDEGEAP
jgi:hypothetical protein